VLTLVTLVGGVLLVLWVVGKARRVSQARAIEEHDAAWRASELERHECLLRSMGYSPEGRKL